VVRRADLEKVTATHLGLERRNDEKIRAMKVR
jgi:hypothetical protein